MAVVSRVATAQITGATGSRTWVATAAVQDTAAGSSVTITVTQSTSGAGPPAVADTLDVSLRIDNTATVVATLGLTPGSASQDVTFFFTNDGLSGGTATAGLLRLRISAVKNTGLASAQYNVTSDNGLYGSAANTYPTGFTGGTLDAGYVRGTMTLTEDLSNTSLGGAPTSPAAYPDSLFVRTTSSAVSYTARALTVALSHGSVSGSTNSTTAVTRDVTFSTVVDDRFPAAATVVSVTVTVPNAALLATPDWTYTSTTDDTLTVDPRLSADLHFQVDDDVFGLSKHSSMQTMLNTQSGFLWPKITNARAEGVNSLTVSHTLDPVNPGSSINTSGSTSTQDSQAGIGSRLDWTAAKPGGRWDWTADVTAPSAIDADTHLIQSGDFTTMLVVDPRLKPIISLSPTVAIEARHLEPGDAMKMSVTVRNSETRKRVAQDSAPTAIVERYDRTAGWQYLAADGVTWTAWGSGAADAHTLVQEADTLSYALTFSSTSGWTTTDIVGIDVTCLVGNTPYPEYVQRELVSNSNRHDGYNFDSLSLLGLGKK